MLLLGFSIAFLILVLCVATAAYFVRYHRRKNGSPEPDSSYLVPKRSLFNQVNPHPFDPHPTLNPHAQHYATLHSQHPHATLGYPPSKGTLQRCNDSGYDAKYPLSSPDDLYSPTHPYNLSGTTIDHNEPRKLTSLPRAPSINGRDLGGRASRSSMASWGLSRFSGLTSFGFTTGNGGAAAEDEEAMPAIPAVPVPPDHSSERTVPLDRANKTSSGSSGGNAVAETTMLDLLPPKDSPETPTAGGSHPRDPIDSEDSTRHPDRHQARPMRAVAQTLTRGIAHPQPDRPVSAASTNPFFGEPSVSLSRVSRVSLDRDTVVGFQPDMNMTMGTHSFIGTPPPVYGDRGMHSGMVVGGGGGIVHSTPVQAPLQGGMGLGMWNLIGVKRASQRNSNAVPSLDRLGVRRQNSPLSEDSRGTILPNGLRHESSEDHGNTRGAEDGSTNPDARRHMSVASVETTAHDVYTFSAVLPPAAAERIKNDRRSILTESRFGTMNSTSTYRASNYRISQAADTLQTPQRLAVPSSPGRAGLSRSSTISHSSEYQPTAKRRSSRGTTIGIPHNMLIPPKLELDVQASPERPLTVVLGDDMPWLRDAIP